MKRQDLYDLRNSIITTLNAANDTIRHLEVALRKAKESQANCQFVLEKFESDSFKKLHDSLEE